MKKYHNCHKDGSDWWVGSVINPIVNSEGAAVEYKAILHDVSDKKRAEWLSVTDALTQVYNRAKFDTVLSTGIHETACYDRPIALILLDIEFFKRINNTFGHQVGDNVLVGVAQVTNEVLRGSDLLVRWGGEEFAVLLPFTHLLGAVSVAEKIREAIGSHRFEKVGQVTASFGVSEYQAGDSVDTLMLRANKALYRAKHDGRNRAFSEE